MVLLKKEIISENVWNAFILSHSPHALFQLWAWGDVEKKMGHHVWRWGWFDKNSLVGVAQIIKVSARRGMFLHIRHGPVGDINFTDLKELAKNERSWFIRISPQVTEPGLYKNMGFVPAPIHAMDAEVCWVLDLDKTEDDLLAGMRKTTRYEIRKAQKMGVKIVKSNDISKFLDLYSDTSNRHNFVQHKGIREEMETLDAQLYLASFEGKILAAAIIVYFGDEAVYHHGASIPSKIPGSYLIQWEAVCEARKRGKKLYNFWGIAPDNKLNHPWRGITLFKTGFGGRTVSFIHAMDYPVTPLYVIPKTIELVRKHLKGY